MKTQTALPKNMYVVVAEQDAVHQRNHRRSNICTTAKENCKKGVWCMCPVDIYFTSTDSTLVVFTAYSTAQEPGLTTCDALPSNG